MRGPDVMYCPTPYPIVERMLAMAGVGKGDLVYDLGCGDGRIVAAAVRRGAKAVGFDIDPAMVSQAVRAMAESGLHGSYSIQLADLFEVDLSPATVVTVYLLQHLNDKLVPQLKKLAPGSMVVSHDFDFTGYQADRTEELQAVDDRGEMLDCPIHLYTMPFKEVTKP